MVSNRVCVIVGGADDLFVCAAKEMAKNGYMVAMISDGSEGASRVADEICTFGGLAKAYHGDYRVTESVMEARTLITSELGRCRCLVNLFGSDEKSSDEIFDVSEMFIRDMLSESGCSVVNICRMSNTAAEKYIADTTKKMAVTLAEYGVRVNAIAYSDIDYVTEEKHHDELTEKNISAVAESSVIPMKRSARPTDIVGALTYLSDANSACYTTGNIIYIDGGLTAAKE